MDGKIDRASNDRYIQIADSLLEQIELGELALGDRLLPEGTLSEAEGLAEGPCERSYIPWSRGGWSPETRFPLLDESPQRQPGRERVGKIERPDACKALIRLDPQMS